MKKATTKTNNGNVMQSRICDLTIQLQKCDRIYADGDYLKSCLDKLHGQYAFAIHSLDTNEDGTLKGLHAHVVYVAPTGTRKRNSEWLSFFYSAFGGVYEKDAINVDAIGKQLLPKKVRYLIHANDEDILAGKYRYDVKSIVTNDSDFFRDFFIQDSKKADATFGRIFQAVYSCNHLTEVIEVLGVETYSKYRWVIKDMWADKLSNI